MRTCEPENAVMAALPAPISTRRYGPSAHTLDEARVPVTGPVNPVAWHLPSPGTYHRHLPRDPTRRRPMRVATALRQADPACVGTQMIRRRRA